MQNSMNTKSNRKTNKTPDLSCYKVTGYSPGATTIKRAIWYFINILFFINPLFPLYRPKRLLLRLFGADIACGVIIKPRVNIKYPWKLSVGKNSWIGEGVWIDNLAEVTIGDNACISQDAYLLTGNHNYKDVAFTLITKSIHIGNGVWVGARTTVCPGIHMGVNSVLTVGSILTSDAAENGIYTGNPAKWVRNRILE